MTNRNMSCPCIGNLLLPRQYLVLHWPPLFASSDQRQHKFTDILNSIYHTRIYTQKSRYSEINHTKIHRTKDYLQFLFFFCFLAIEIRTTCSRLDQTNKTWSKTLQRVYTHLEQCKQRLRVLFADPNRERQQKTGKVAESGWGYGLYGLWSEVPVYFIVLGLVWWVRLKNETFPAWTWIIKQSQRMGKISEKGEGRKGG